MINQEIRYQSKEATEVFLVWGVNNWSLQSPDLRPPGTYIKGNLMYTPMKNIDGTFTAKMVVEENTTIDYVFWITKGVGKKGTDIWDHNTAPQNEYHTVSLNDSAVLIQSNIKARPKDPLTILDYSWPLLFIISVLLLGIAALKKYTLKDWKINSNPFHIVIASACTLLLISFLIRPSVAGISWDIYLHPVLNLPKLLWAGYYDLLFVLFLTIPALLILFSMKKHEGISFAFSLFFVGICFVSLLASIFNIRMAEWMEKDSVDAIVSSMSIEYMIKVTCICMAAVLIALFIMHVLSILPENEFNYVWLFTGIPLLIAYCFMAPRKIEKNKWDYNRLANPVTLFVGNTKALNEKTATFNFVNENKNTPFMNRECQNAGRPERRMPELIKTYYKK
jgi:hypothetical protein